MYGHADLLATLGRCKGDPACTEPPITEDDQDATIRRCARHALEHLRRTLAVTE